MLAAAKMVAFMFTADYERTRAFYVDKLGFEVVSHDQFALVLRCGETSMRVVKLPNFTPLQATVLGWQVSDIVSVVAWLKQRGVAIEKYPFMNDAEVHTFPGGDKVAWFK